MEGTTYAQPSLIPVFRCKSGDMSYNSSYLFDINWYINGNLVSNKTNVTFEDLDSAVLRENEWIDTYKLNMQVKMLRLSSVFLSNA